MIVNSPGIAPHDFQFTRYSTLGAHDVDTKESRALARTIAQESLVLLHTDGTLPWYPNTIRRLAVIGPNANSTGSIPPLWPCQRADGVLLDSIFVMGVNLREQHLRSSLSEKNMWLVGLGLTALCTEAVLAPCVKALVSLGALCPRTLPLVCVLRLCFTSLGSRGHRRRTASAPTQVFIPLVPRIVSGICRLYRLLSTCLTRVLSTNVVKCTLFSTFNALVPQRLHVVPQQLHDCDGRSVAVGLQRVWKGVRE